MKKAEKIINPLDEIIAALPKGKVAEVVKWKLYFDKKTRKPCGQNYFVCVSALDEALPPFQNQPPHVEERMALMVILNKEKKNGN